MNRIKMSNKKHHIYTKFSFTSFLMNYEIMASFLLLYFIEQVDTIVIFLERSFRKSCMLMAFHHFDWKMIGYLV